VPEPLPDHSAVVHQEHCCHVLILPFTGISGVACRRSR
jgi:hypothetical protein